MKGLVKHLPGLETPEERLYYEVLYNAKKQQLEVLKYEMYGSEAQTAYFRSQVVTLNNHMKALKKAYFEQKKWENCNREKNKEEKSCQILFQKKKNLPPPPVPAQEKSRAPRRPPPPSEEEMGEQSAEEEDFSAIMAAALAADEEYFDTVQKEMEETSGWMGDEEEEEDEDTTTMSKLDSVNYYEE